MTTKEKLAKVRETKKCLIVYGASDIPEVYPITTTIYDAVSFVVLRGECDERHKKGLNEYADELAKDGVCGLEDGCFKIGEIIDSIQPKGVKLDIHIVLDALAQAAKGKPLDPEICQTIESIVKDYDYKDFTSEDAQALYDCGSIQPTPPCGDKCPKDEDCDDFRIDGQI